MTQSLYDKGDDYDYLSIKRNNTREEQNVYLMCTIKNENLYILINYYTKFIYRLYAIMKNKVKPKYRKETWRSVDELKFFKRVIQIFP